jgi:hypothetical protein
VLTFSGLDASGLFKLQQRVQDMYWKQRKLSANIMRDRFA